MYITKRKKEKKIPLLDTRHCSSGLRPGTVIDGRRQISRERKQTRPTTVNARLRCALDTGHSPVAHTDGLTITSTPWCSAMLAWTLAANATRSKSGTFTCEPLWPQLRPPVQLAWRQQ
eukprot:5623343-Prymnesium_polylepis.1